MCRLSLLAGALAVSFLTVGEVQAADLAPPTIAPPIVPVFNWTGFYIGANGGGAYTHQTTSLTQVTTLGPTAGSGSADGSGGLIGGQIGYNYELPSNIVFGIEADADFAKITGSASGCATFTGAGRLAGCATSTVTLDDLGTVRGRLGYASGPVLIYGTGGWAWGDSSGGSTATCISTKTKTCTASQTPVAPFTGGVASFSNSLSGWTAGAGVEVGFYRNWIVRLEYLRVGFDDVQTNFTATAKIGGVTGTSTNSVSSNAGTNVIRVGINYLF